MVLAERVFRGLEEFRIWMKMGSTSELDFGVSVSSVCI